MGDEREVGLLCVLLMLVLYNSINTELLVRRYPSYLHCKGKYGFKMAERPVREDT